MISAVSVLDICPAMIMRLKSDLQTCTVAAKMIDIERDSSKSCSFILIVLRRM
jgi:hypothetical protein